MGYARLRLEKDKCLNCDICNQDTKLYITINTRISSSGHGQYMFKLWSICVKCVYRLDYLMTSYIIEKWNDIINETLSEANKLIALRDKIKDCLTGVQ